MTQSKQPNKQATQKQVSPTKYSRGQQPSPYSPTRKSSTPLFAKFEKRLKLFLTVPRPSRPVFSQPPNMKKVELPLTWRLRLHYTSIAKWYQECLDQEINISRLERRLLTAQHTKVINSIRKKFRNNSLSNYLIYILVKEDDWLILT